MLKHPIWWGLVLKMPNFRRRCLTLFLVASWVPAAYAVRVPGIRNFHEVDANVYRGAQPASNGFRYLSGIGVKTVLNLRMHDGASTREKEIVTSLGMKYVNVPMTGLTPPTPAQITRILALLEDRSGGPVFVHCMRGADRTGAVIAAYRIDHDHWSNGQALLEARTCGMSMFQFPRMAFIRSFHPILAIQPAQTALPPQNTN
jgi:protein-tyrosine phosphatase